MGDYFLRGPQVRLEEYVFGADYTEKDIIVLNNLIKDKIDAVKKQPEIFLHYSDRENTYIYNIQYLLKDLDRKKIRYSVDIAHYEDHGDVSLFFPKYLKECVMNIIG